MVRETSKWQLFRLLLKPHAADLAHEKLRLCWQSLFLRNLMASPSTVVAGKVGARVDASRQSPSFGKMVKKLRMASNRSQEQTVVVVGGGDGLNDCSRIDDDDRKKIGSGEAEGDVDGGDNVFDRSDWTLRTPFRCQKVVTSLRSCCVAGSRKTKVYLQKVDW